MRILVGLREVAGIMGRLAAGLEALGHKVTFVELTPHPYGYNENRPASALARQAAQLGAEPERPRMRDQFRRWSMVVRAALTHDAFIFCGGESFTHQTRSWDLRLLKLLRRKVVFLMLGSDHRPPYFSYYGWNKRTSDGTEAPVQAAELAERVRTVKERVVRADRWARAVVGLGMSSQFHTRPVIDWLQLGLPAVPPPEPLTGRPAPQGRTLVALHCPSFREGKGTALVRAAVRNLNARGLPLELRELHGVPNDEVVRELRDCDFVIDELFSDTPMAAFATEAALMGRAAVVGGYGWEALEKHLPRDQWPPVITTLPEALEPTLESLIRAPDRIAATGRAAQEFVAGKWNARAVAERLTMALTAQVPAAWLAHPATMDYPWGTGVRPWHVRCMVQSLVQHGGPAALMLESCPPLLERLARMSPADEEPARAALETRILELERMLAARDEKLENFRHMISRRDEKIGKLERRLGIAPKANPEE